MATGIYTSHILDWTRQLGTTTAAADEYSYSVAIDSINNVYITGSTLGNLNVAYGATDGFVAKYDSGGNRVWIRQLGTTGTDIARGIATDSMNNVYITGETNGNLVANVNPTLANDAFLAKYDSSGNIVWTRLLRTHFHEYAYGIATDSNNNVYITGHTNSNLPDYVGDHNKGGYDVFLVKYNSSGNIVWTRQLGTNIAHIHEYSYSVATDSINNVYITGSTSTHGNLYVAYGGIDAFLAKYDSNGNRVWTRQLGTTGTDIARGIATDSNNNVYITGETNGNLDVTYGGTDAFLAKYDSSGNIVWTRQLGTTSIDIARGIATDSVNNVYITGETNGNLDVAYGSNDAFLAMYDSGGNRVWTKQLGTTSIDIAHGIAIDSTDSVYITGQTYGNLGGLPGGSHDAFLAKYIDPYPIPADITLDNENTYNVASGNVQVSIVDVSNISTNKVSYWYSTTGGVPNINSGVLNNGPSQTNYRFYIPLTSGTYTISVYAKKPSGNSSIVSKNVTVYTTPFAPTIDTINTKSVTSGNLNVAFTDTLNVVTNQVEYIYLMYDSTKQNQILYNQILYG